MRFMVGAGTPWEFLAPTSANLMLITIAADALTGIVILATGTQAAILAVSFEPDLHH